MELNSSFTSYLLGLLLSFAALIAVSKAGKGKKEEKGTECIWAGSRCNPVGHECSLFTDYNGNQNTSAFAGSDGLLFKCDKWSKHGDRFENMTHNFCRNPDQWYHGPYCFVLVGDVPVKQRCFKLCENSDKNGVWRYRQTRYDASVFFGEDKEKEYEEAAAENPNAFRSLTPATQGGIAAGGVILIVMLIVGVIVTGVVLVRRGTINKSTFTRFLPGSQGYERSKDLNFVPEYEPNVA